MTPGDKVTHRDFGGNTDVVFGCVIEHDDHDQKTRVKWADGSGPTWHLTHALMLLEPHDDWTLDHAHPTGLVAAEITSDEELEAERRDRQRHQPSATEPDGCYFSWAEHTCLEDIHHDGPHVCGCGESQPTDPSSD